MESTSEPRTELTPEAERRVFWLTLGVAVALLVTLTAVSLALWPRENGELVWPVASPIVMWVPIPILEWAFAGGMVAVLYRLAMRRDLPPSRLGLYTWVVAKPIVGLFMGSLVYFLALAAAKLLDGDPAALAGALWLNVVAFVGGFSEDLSVGLIQRFVRRRLGEDAREEKSDGERREPAAGPK